MFPIAFVGIDRHADMRSAKCICGVFRTKAAVKLHNPTRTALPEIPHTYYTFDFELIFGDYILKAFLMLPFFFMIPTFSFIFLCRIMTPDLRSYCTFLDGGPSIYHQHPTKFVRNYSPPPPLLYRKPRK